jgi:5-methylcytosine-specific restriction endonuclease McrA
MKITEETRAKLRKAWEARRLTFVPPMKGKKMSDESRRKMSEAAKRRGSNRTGKRHTPETRAKIAAITRERTARGESHYAYTHGKHQRDKSDRRSAEYRQWRDAVYRRDNYTCRHCGDSRGGNLQAHHVKPYASNPELRYAVGNGLTLCQDCHERLHLKPIPSRADLRRRKKHVG